MKACLVLNGTRPTGDLVELLRSSYVICADGAVNWLIQEKITPNLIVGDMDSANSDAIAFFEKAGSKIIRLNRDKDETDAQAAIDIALERGVDNLTIFGGIGGRVDHTLANLMLLIRIAKHGAKGCIVDAYNQCWATNGKFEIEGDIGDSLSVIPLDGKVEIAYSKGLKWPLKGLVLQSDFPRGISNCLTDNKAEFEIISGWALVVKAKDPE